MIFHPKYLISLKKCSTVRNVSFNSLIPESSCPRRRASTAAQQWTPACAGVTNPLGSSNKVHSCQLSEKKLSNILDNKLLTQSQTQITTWNLYNLCNPSPHRIPRRPRSPPAFLNQIAHRRRHTFPSANRRAPGAPYHRVL